MDLTQLQYFRTVARLENVTKAARELYLSQPHVSQQIRALEEEVGFAVFARSNTQARITNGELFYVQRFYMP